jgi:nitrite reductase (NADH) large subunit
MSEPLVIIGNGMAAARLVEELSTRALGRYAIAVIGKEPRLAYNRVLLSSVLAGEMTSEEIELKPASWWRDRGVTLHYGHAAVEIDAAARQVKLSDGSVLPFAKLVLATGSQPIRLNTPGAELPDVYTFRDSGDVDALLGLARQGKRVAVIGGGLLGLEAAYGLAKAGAGVTLVHLMDRLMERQLDAPAAALLRNLVESKNIEVLLNAATSRIIGSDRVEGLEFKDGSRLDCDAVVFAAGIRPDTALGAMAGCATGRGVVVNDVLQTSVPDIYALGECAEHRDVCYGLVEPAYEQARILASYLAGRTAAYSGSVVSTNLKVSGVSVFSAGDFMGGEGTEAIVLSDPRSGIDRKLVIAGEKLLGAVLVGDTGDALWYLELIRSGTDIAPLRHALMFGRDICDLKAA